MFFIADTSDKKEYETWTRSSKQKVQLFAEYLTNTLRLLSRKMVEENVSAIRENSSETIKHVTIKKLNKEIHEN